MARILLRRLFLADEVATGAGGCKGAEDIVPIEQSSERGKEQAKVQGDE
jgi:hypothetical protein